MVCASMVVPAGVTLMIWLFTTGPVSPPAREPNAVDHSDPMQACSSEPDVMCGPNCLWQISHAFGKSYSLGAIKHMAGTTLTGGTTIDGMLNATRAMGLRAVAVKTDLAMLARDPRTAILLLQFDYGNHYVILDQVGKSGVRLLDADRFRFMSTQEFASLWDGHAILISRNAPPDQHRFRTCLGGVLRATGWLLTLVAGALAAWRIWPGVNCLRHRRD
jgi:ABC-type bacteriocin/lantibiotic exporter with double-glycine peptidase domain